MGGGGRRTELPVRGAALQRPKKNNYYIRRELGLGAVKKNIKFLVEGRGGNTGGSKLGERVRL